MSVLDRASSERLAEERGSGPVGRLWGRLRRMTIAATEAAGWRLTGHASMREALTAEVFQHIGLATRPPAGQGEAMIVMIGKDGPVVIATRDRATLLAVIDDILGPDESALHNSVALVHVKADATIEARSAGGVAAPLTTHADMQALANVLDTWVPVPNDGGAALKTLIDALIATGWPFGTSVLKGE